MLSFHPQFDTSPFETRANQLAETLRWLEGLGIRHEGSRFSSYKKILDDVSAGCRPADMRRKGHTNGRVYNAIFETEELCRAHRALAIQASVGVSQRLKHMIQGPRSYADEVTSASSNKARNFAFELALMANASINGLKLIEHESSDVTLSFGNYLVFIQCKRPQGQLKIPVRAQEAVKQLERSYATTNKSRIRGIVALDLSAALNPRCIMPIFRSKHELHQTLSNAMKRLLVSIRGSHPRIRDNRTVAVLVRTRYVAALNIAPKPEPCVCELFGISSLPHVSSREDAMLEDLGARFVWPSAA
jgi:hypothetical protein